MSRIFALIENNIVGNVILADEWPGAIDVTDVDPRPGPDWTYDGQAFAPPAPPPAPAPEPEPVRIPRDDFIERFTPQEWLTNQNRAQTDANLSMALALLMGKPDGMVTLTSPRVSQALAYMVAIGTLTAPRAAAIGAH